MRAVSVVSLRGVAAYNVELVLNNKAIKQRWARAIGLTALAALVVGCGTEAPPQHKHAVLPPAPEISSGYRSGMVPVQAQRHMAAAATPLATQAGQAMLRRGGSAIDAAIAMQAVLTLVEPQATGIVAALSSCIGTESGFRPLTDVRQHRVVRTPKVGQVRLTMIRGL